MEEVWYHVCILNITKQYNFIVHQNISRQHITLFLLAVSMIALVYSKFLISVCMLLILVINMFDVQRRGFPIRIRVSFFISILSQPQFLAVTLLFFIVLVGGIWSEDTGYFLERLRLKLPLIGLPVAIASLPAFSRRQTGALLYCFVIIMTIASIGVGVHYIQDFDAINQGIKRGHPIPTPCSHIRFSLMLAFSIVTGIYLFYKNAFWKYTWERWLVFACTVFLLFFIHVLSVRSGLVSLYTALLFMGIAIALRSRKYVIGALAIALLCIAPIAAYYTMPSFKNKFHYSLHDIRMHLKGEGSHYSDSERITSLQAGLKIGNAHKLFGVGPGDLKAEVRKVYAHDFPHIAEVKMPHNQFLSVYAGSGIVGLCIFVIGFFYPLFYHKNHKNILFAAFYCIVFLSFMIENTIENAVGIAFYTTFLMIGLQYLKNNVEETH